jgi:probable F420-dependent oxidoreductase
VKFTVGIAMSPLEQLPELAKTAEECGFSSIPLPDSLFYMQAQSEKYPYTPDGSRFWTPDTPWVDPLIGATAMAAVTSRIHFYTNVLKLGSRNPLLLARQVGSVAAMSGNRFGFGVGIGWAPEEFEWCGAPYVRRGARVDEMVEVIKLVLGGGMVEFHGEFFDFDKLQMSPAPRVPVPFYIGGHTGPALRRAARTGDDWCSAMIDRFGRSGYEQLAEAGVTDTIVVPWIFDGLGFDAELGAKQDSLRRFAEQYIESPIGVPA